MLPMIISHLSALLSVTTAVVSLLDCVHVMLAGGDRHVTEVSRIAYIYMLSIGTLHVNTR